MASSWHAYQIISYNHEQDIVKLYNPWGVYEEYSLKDLELHYDVDVSYLLPLTSQSHWLIGTLIRNTP